MPCLLVYDYAVLVKSCVAFLADPNPVNIAKDQSGVVDMVGTS